jgi:hypothetical protein
MRGANDRVGHFRSTRSPMLWHGMFSAAPIGGLIPIALPLILLTIGSLSKSAKPSLAGWAAGQAELVGALVAAGCKAITGCVHPARGLGPDISHMFRFGFWRGGVFWGWPSSHTTIAFAMAATRQITVEDPMMEASDIYRLGCFLLGRERLV